MTVLICDLSTGKGSWGHLTRLISDGNWEKIFLVSNDWGKENFAPKKEVSWILINRNMGFDLMKETILHSLPETKDIALNLISGEGKEHMAIMLALKEKYNNNYKLTILTKDGLKFY